MGYFRRRIDDELLEWKKSLRRKPLLVRGARQVGKSRSIRHLGETFSYYLEVNFETNPDLKSVFEQEHDVKKICDSLSIIFSTPVRSGETLLFLDEIQACPEALKSLWSFKENLPELHVVAAGSLLEFTLKELPSYGVGRVSSLFMYPMAFDEYLWAIGKEEWDRALSVADSDHPLFEALYKELVNAFRIFLLVGGMPASVAAWVETRDYRNCMTELADIQQTYYDDFRKYSGRISPELLRNTLQSIITQTGGKFIYSRVPGGYSVDDVKRALGLLSDAGLIKSVRHTAANGLPLGGQINEKFNKYLYLDTGLWLRVLDLDFGGAQSINELILTGSQEDLVNKGKLAELSAGWEMVKAADSRHSYELYYWENLSKGATSEVDYVIPY
ncbi:MAG: AAA family ATPase, partial [Muribaculaceae bacterium]|nr:AAA family ATPase [Muribaculaceae bacterium]